MAHLDCNLYVILFEIPLYWSLPGGGFCLVESYALRREGLIMIRLMHAIYNAIFNITLAAHTLSTRFDHYEILPNK